MIRSLALAIITLLMLSACGVGTPTRDPCLDQSNSDFCRLQHARAQATITRYEGDTAKQATAQAVEEYHARLIAEQQATAAADAADREREHDRLAGIATEQALIIDAQIAAGHARATEQAQSATATAVADGAAIARRQAQADIDTAYAGELLKHFLAAAFAVAACVLAVFAARAIVRYLDRKARTVESGGRVYLLGEGDKLISPDLAVHPVTDLTTINDRLSDDLALQVRRYIEIVQYERAKAQALAQNGHAPVVYEQTPNTLPEPHDKFESIMPPLPDRVLLPEPAGGDQIMLGVTDQGHLADRAVNLGGTAVVGIRNSGKSIFMRGIAIQLSRAGVHLYLADPLDHCFAARIWNRIENVAHPVATTRDAFLTMIAALEFEIEQRVALFDMYADHDSDGAPPENVDEYNVKPIADKPLPQLAILLDEANTWLHDKAVADRFADLVRRNRKYGLTIYVLAAHSFKAKTINPDITQLCTTRIVFRVESWRQADALLEDKSQSDQAVKITQPGRAFARIGNHIGMIQTYLVERHDYLCLLTDKPVEPVAVPSVSTVSRQPVIVKDERREPEPDPVEVLAWSILHIVTANGSRSAMAKAAGFSQYGGSYVRRIDEAVDLIESDRDRFYSTTDRQTIDNAVIIE